MQRAISKMYAERVLFMEILLIILSIVFSVSWNYSFWSILFVPVLKTKFLSV